MPPRPLTARQARENKAFLAELARTGNARLAARTLGRHRATFTRRRAKHPAFALQWDCALVAAQAALSRVNPPRNGEGDHAKHGGGVPPGRDPRSRTRTRGGEPVVTRLANGRLQLRLARPGRITHAAEQAFLRALSASANIRLSAAAAGFAHSSFYARARKSRAFAREKRLALAMGYDRLEAAALMAALPESHADDAWRHNDPPPIPPMTADQALQLLYLHEKSIRQSWEQPHRRKRRGETWEAYRERLRAMWVAEQRRAAEDEAVRAAASATTDEDGRRDDRPALPALDQVTGWSKADPNKQPHSPSRALFGGWRIGDWKKRPGSG